MGRSTGTAWSDGAIRGEARRLVSGVFDVAARAARDLPGEPNCGCPVCRTVTAVRAPDPAVATKVADAVGEAASGLAGVLRALAELGSHRPAAPDPSGERADTPRASGERADTPQQPSGAARPATENQKGDVGCH